MSAASDFAATATAYFHDLQSRVCAAFEAFEPQVRFTARHWTKPPGHRLQGGGESRLMRGAVFEKVGVNVSHVWGVLPPEARGQVTGAQESQGRFTACGISLVAHMVNPYVPAVHMNLRYLSTSHAWFGGGTDLTPTFPFDEDTADFHTALRGPCDAYGAGTYAQLKAWCDRYFYLPHRQEPMGMRTLPSCAGWVRPSFMSIRGSWRGARTPLTTTPRASDCCTSVAVTWSSISSMTAAPASASAPTRIRKRI
jgi:coproporphyrinogen III oxidase